MQIFFVLKPNLCKSVQQVTEYVKLRNTNVRIIGIMNRICIDYKVQNMRTFQTNMQMSRVPCLDNKQ